MSYIIIPVGHRCNAIDFLRKFGLYTHNSPLDWSILTLPMMIKMLNSGFSDLFNDLYDMSQNVILYAKNHTELTGTDIVKLDSHTHENCPFTYELYSDNWKFGFLNLNYYDGKKDIYSSDCFNIIHYDMKSADILNKMETRLNSLKTYKNVIYFYITIVHDDISVIGKYQDILDTLKVDATFFIAIAINKEKVVLAEDYTIKHNQHTLYILRVPSFKSQISLRSKSVAENDPKYDRKTIGWCGMAHYIKQHFPTNKT